MLKKGITMIALIVTMIIMVIFISVVTISGTSVINDSKKITLASEIAMIQEAVNSYCAKNNGQYPISESIILDIKNLSDEGKIQFNSEDVIDNRVSLGKIDYSKIGIKNLNYGNNKDGENDIYAVSLDTGNVYYAKGLTIKKYTYFKLTDDLKNIINYSVGDNNLNENKDGIIFIPSTTKVTNSLDIEIKIPNKYKNVIINSDIFVPKEKYNDGINTVYKIEGINKNINIKVTYFINDKSSSATYNIHNINNEKLILNVDENQEVYISSESKKAYVNFTVNSDDIKVMKYETDKIPEENIVTYFANNGIKLSNTTLTINPGVKNLTLYVEDNVGNYVFKYIVVKDDVYNKLNGEIK